MVWLEMKLNKAMLKDLIRLANKAHFFKDKKELSQDDIEFYKTINPKLVRFMAKNCIHSKELLKNIYNNLNINRNAKETIAIHVNKYWE